MLSHPLLRSRRTVGVLASETVILVAAAAYLPLPAVLLIAGLLAVIVSNLLMFRADLVGALDPPTYRFVFALVDADKSAVELARLERVGEIPRDERIRRMAALIEELQVIPQPSDAWDAFRKRKIEEILAATEVLGDADAGAGEVERVRQLRAANARDFVALRNDSFNFWR